MGALNMARKNVLSNLMSASSEKLTPVNPVQEEPRQHVTYKGIGFSFFSKVGKVCPHYPQAG